MLAVADFASQGWLGGFKWVRKTRRPGSVEHAPHRAFEDLSVCCAQVMVIPISEASAGYAQEVRRVLRDAHFFVDTDLADSKMQKKVREAQLAQYNYILVRAPGVPSP